MNVFTGRYRCVWPDIKRRCCAHCASTPLALPNSLRDPKHDIRNPRRTNGPAIEIGFALTGRVPQAQSRAHLWSVVY